MDKQYMFYHDPGHGWLRVLKTEIEPIKDKISHYSYMNGKYVYLEEDSDAAIFLRHKFGNIFDAKSYIKEKYVENTAIRNYVSYSAEAI